MKTYICNCLECQQACKTVACMGTPKEIQAIIDAGFGDRLQIRDDNDPSLDFIVIMPKNKNWTNDGRRGTCTFFQNGKCQLHNLGLKPIEGRVAIHGKDNPRALYHQLAQAWNSKYAKKMVEDFRDKQL